MDFNLLNPISFAAAWNFRHLLPMENSPAPFFAKQLILWEAPEVDGQAERGDVLHRD